MDKKDFLHHPSLQFMSSAPTPESTGTPAPSTQEAIPTPTPTPTPTPAGTEKPRRAGVRSRRTQILLEPGLHEHALAAATKLGISFNEYLHRALRAYNPPQQEK